MSANPRRANPYEAEAAKASATKLPDVRASIAKQSTLSLKSGDIGFATKLLSKINSQGNVRIGTVCETQANGHVQ